MGASSVIRILLVGDPETIQQNWKNPIELAPDLEIVGMTNDGKAALEQVIALEPDIVIINIELYGSEGLTVADSISQRFTDTKVLIVSNFDDETYIERALQVGAKGYLLTTTLGQELVNAIRSVAQGYFQLGPGLLEKVLHKVLATQTNSNLGANPYVDEALEARLSTLEKVSEKFFYNQKEVEKKLSEALRVYHRRNDLAHRQVSRMSQRVLTLEKQIIQIHRLLNTAMSLLLVATLLGGFLVSVFWLGLV